MVPDLCGWLPTYCLYGARVVWWVGGDGMVAVREISSVVQDGDLGFQIGYWDSVQATNGVGDPPGQDVAQAPVEAQPKASDAAQSDFAWWLDWPGGWARRCPIRAYPGYVKGLAYYVQHNGIARGGESSRVMQGDLSLDMRVGQALDIIREKVCRDDKAKKRAKETFGSPADCAILWYGNALGVRPCGCDNLRLCSLCGPKEADVLARDACEFLYEEFLEAVKPRVGKLECMGAAWEVPCHKRLSAQLEGLMADDPARYRKEINRLLGDMWQIIELAYPGCQVAGYQSLQLYGEGHPGEAHVHAHHVLAPVVLEGDVWEWFQGEVRVDDAGRSWYSNEKVKVPGQFRFKPLPGHVDAVVLEKLRWEWGHRQIMAAKRLGLDPADIGAERCERQACPGGCGVKVECQLVGVVHLSFFGFRQGYDRALKRAKGYLGYQARWPGRDLVSGLKGDGSRYTWTGGLRSKPNPEAHGPGARFTEKWAKGGRPIYERDLAPWEVALAIWRLDKFPKDFPRLRWRGYFSTGNRAEVMRVLEWEQVKVKPPDDDLLAGQLLRPVEKWRVPDIFPGEWKVWGLVFECIVGGTKIGLEWYKLNLGPVGYDGKSLVKGRAKCWGPVARDGPG